MYYKSRSVNIGRTRFFLTCTAYRNTTYHGAKDNHQFENALFYKQHGCNWILNQNEINEVNLGEKLVNIIKNKDEYLDKKKNMKNFSYQNTWNNINQKIITIINEN